MKKKLLFIAAGILSLNIISQAQSVMLDPSFGSNGIAIFSPGSQHDVARDIVALPDNSMIICGTGQFNGSSAGLLMRILNDGSQDMTFGSGGISIMQFGTDTYAYKIAKQQDGKIIVSGTCYVTISNSEFFAARFLADGTPDSTFGTNGHFLTSYSGYEEECYAMALQNDGKIVLAGRTYSVPLTATFFTRLNPDGSLDNSFGTNGYTVIDATIQYESIRTVDFLSDGTIVGFGYGYYSTPLFGDKILMVKLDASGNPYPGFGNNGALLPSVFNDVSTVYGLSIKNDSLFVTGKIYDADNYDVLLVSKLDQDGNADPTFGTNGITVIKPGGTSYNAGYDLKISPDGKIYVCGTSGSAQLLAPRDFILLRYTQNGLPDTSFTSTGYIITSIGSSYDDANALDFQNDGKVVLAGFTNAVYNDIVVARYLVSDFIPVELASFSVNKEDDYVRLEWTTASETNNSHFLIERSKDKVNFRQIGRIEGKGTATELQHYSFIDQEVSQGLFYYRIKQVDFDGSYSYSQVESINLSMLEKYELAQNYPNPFNPSTTIRYDLPVSSYVTLKIYNTLGEEVATLVNEEKPAGSYQVKFSAGGGSANGGNGSDLPSGVYIYRLNAGSYTAAKKLVLLK